MLSKSLSRWVERIDKATLATKADLLLVGNYLKEQVLDRTANGLDADGNPFAPYSTKHPYYWNPSADKGASWATQNRSMNRMIAKLGGSKKTGIIRDEKGKALGHRAGNGTSIKFASYAAFKQALGRGSVDLFGPRAPHMLQALKVRVAEDKDAVYLGVYGEAAARAEGHQYGNPRRGLPQRKFLGATPENRKYALKLLHAQIQGRIRSKSGGGDSRFPTMPLPFVPPGL